MSSLFDDLNRKLQAEQREQGMSAWDLAQLSPRLRKVVRTVLRGVEISYSELYQATVATDDDPALSQTELDNALEHLLQQAWLVRSGEGEPATYMVNLRRKRPSRLGSSLWDLLDSRIASTSPDQ
jgi:hypothetical protein